MIPVEQTKLTNKDGNCHAACIASIFEVPLDEVPQPLPEELVSAEAWQIYAERLEREFFAPRGLRALCSAAHDADGNLWKCPGYSILCAKSPRGDYLHAVVALDGEVVHDPHPGRDAGIGEPHDWTYFIVLDASKLKG